MVAKVVVLTACEGLLWPLTPDPTSTGPDLRAPGRGCSPAIGGRRFGSAVVLPLVAAAQAASSGCLRG
jgi:hypothetical protein